MIQLLLTGAFLAVLDHHPVTGSTTTEERKAAFRQAVIDNYDETTSLTSCPCSDDDEDRLARLTFPPPIDCGNEMRGNNFRGTNIVDGFNSGIAVFPFSNLTIPREDEALDNLFCRVFCEERSTGDFSLTLLMRTLGHGDAALQSKPINRLQESYDSGELRLWQAPGEDHNM